jgi:methylenetetrahydrofolate reductase (NADPH)
LPQVFRIDLPEHLIRVVEKCKTNLDVRKVGIEFAVQQSKELLAAGVPFLHYYSIGKSDNIHAIASELF